MTNKAKIRYLSQYVSVVKEYDEAHESLIRFRAKIHSAKSQTLSDMPKATTQNDKLAGYVAKLEQLEEIVNSRLKKLRQIRIDIESIIARLDDSNHRRILTLKYIEGMRWEEVCVKMNYSWAQTHRIHSICLSKINI